MPDDIKTPNYVKRNRRWVTVKRHLPIILKPLAVSIILTLIWRLILFPNSIHFQDFAGEPIMFIIIPMVAFIYVIFSGIAVTSVFDQYKIISKCVVKKDLDSFLIYRDEQLPIMIHLLIGTLSVIIIGSVMLFDYQGHTIIAMFTIMAIVFVLLLIWIVTTELDNFQKSIWFKAKIPPEWFEIDIDKFFTDKNKDILDKE